MNSNHNPIVIVGAGHSGARAAAALRKHGWKGGIELIGGERHLPYDRPPLSKAVLTGMKSVEQCVLYQQSWYEEKGINLVMEGLVSRILPERCEVLLGNGDTLAYHRLLLATGARPKPLAVPGSDLEGVWPLRTPENANAIAMALRKGGSLVVIGGGIIGFEVAAAAAGLGCTVHVLELASRVMGRNLPAAVSEALVAEHRAHGVDVRLGVQVAGLEGSAAVQAVRLSSGERIACDAVVYGLGVQPRTDLARSAGLEIDNGIRTNAFLQTKEEYIFACGDVCCYDSHRYGRPIRLENWRNAEDQADTVARNILGQSNIYDEVPWFWSNQFDFALQVAGLPAEGTVTEKQAIGNAQLFLSYSGDGVLCGASALGPMRDVAGSIRNYRTQLAVGASEYILSNTIAQ